MKEKLLQDLRRADIAIGEEERTQNLFSWMARSGYQGSGLVWRGSSSEEKHDTGKIQGKLDDMGQEAAREVPAEEK